MTPYFDDGQVKLDLGHVLDALAAIPSESVQVVVTSPPYWSLRSYATEPQIWGGSPGHAHEWGDGLRTVVKRGPVGSGMQGGKSNREGYLPSALSLGNLCECGAWRGELGHEPTPTMFVQHLVDVFHSVWRVLKMDGVCFVNIGDAYNAYNGAAGPSSKIDQKRSAARHQLPSGFKLRDKSLKPKDLILIPERFALAMQDDGWYVRSRIAWCKTAPMPESIQDRPTSAWEHVWMFTKDRRYLWNAEAVRVHGNEWKGSSGTFAREHSKRSEPLVPGSIAEHRPDRTDRVPAGRNLWNYWLIGSHPEPHAHFATFPREIPRLCIAAASHSGDTVLDPFVGSGTTCQVARSMLRRSIGIDLNEAYLRDIALRKTAQMALMPAASE